MADVRALVCAVISRSSPDFKSKKRKLQRPEDFATATAAVDDLGHSANS